ncbi:hypothetical protein CHS0354_022185, partial [Potamilus streckersoni]
HLQKSRMALFSLHQHRKALCFPTPSNTSGEFRGGWVGWTTLVPSRYAWMGL